jgi:hypothetical protein
MRDGSIKNININNPPHDTSTLSQDRPAVGLFTKRQGLHQTQHDSLEILEACCVPRLVWSGRELAHQRTVGLSDGAGSNANHWMVARRSQR